MSKEKNDDVWIICPECKTKLKKENISAHLKHVHDKKIDEIDEPSIKILPKKGQKQKKSMNLSIGIIAVVLVALLVIIGVAFFVLSGPSDVSNNLGWLDDYTPVHSTGTGDSDFWINFPSGNPSSGQEVDHLSWIVDSLRTKPVLFVVHRTGCVGCAAQAERVIELGEKYDEEVKFYDLDAFDGASNDILQKANEVYMYDPNGPPGYIALTGIYTYVKENGAIKIGWHAWEAPNDMTISDSDLETWIKDAIYYYNINK